MNRLHIHILVTIFSLLLFQTTAFSQERFETILKQQIVPDGPGMAVVIQQGRNIIYSGAYGKANIELNVPLTSKSVFRIGSLTKQFTGAAIMMLQEQGKLSIQDDIHKYIPDFPTKGNMIKITHLLSHTSGLGDYTDNEHIVEKLIQTPVTVDEMLSLFAKESILFKAGEQMAYSNSGYVLLGKIIEVVSGQSYADFIEQNIFKKLGMNQSSYGGRKIVNNRAAGYTEEDGIYNASIIDMSWPYSAGSLLSTVHDLALWNYSLVNGKIISKKSYKQMIAYYILSDGSKSAYGFGLENKLLNKFKAIGHDGLIPGYSSDSLYFPEKDTFVAVLTNSDSIDPRGIVRLLAAKALNIDMPEFKKAKIETSKLNKFIGTYRVNDESVRGLSLENGKFFAQFNNYTKHEVFPMSENSFYYGRSINYFVINHENGKLVMNFYSNLSETPIKAIKFK